MIRRVLRKVQGMASQSAAGYLWEFLMDPGPNRRGRTPFGAEELKLVRQALASQNLCCVDGQMVPRFEKEFAMAYGVPYAVASTSGTAAIHVAVGALDLEPGSEIITAPITDLGTIIPIISQNCIPVFADIDETFNMDPADVERKITPQTKAIIVVHLFGNPCNMDAMVDIAKRHRLPLIEDSCQAHMTMYKGRYLGTIGDIGCFSFQQSKHMTTGDGGMTITSNKQYYERMKLFADKGYARKGFGPRAYLFHAPNYRMTELVGAVGLAQLKKVAGVVAKRRELGEYMTQLLASVNGVKPVPLTEGGTSSYWLSPMTIPGVDVSALALQMRKKNVTALPGYTGKPIYLCSESLSAKKTFGSSEWPFTGPWVSKSYEYREGLCPRAEQALEHLLCVPFDESWDKGQVDHVVRVLDAALKNAGTSQTTYPETPREQRTIEPIRSSGQKTVRIGIVGCGQMGRWHLDAFKKNAQVEIVAFADTNIESANKFAAGVKGRAYRSVKDMIAQETLDGVSVCTVPATHREIVIDLLEKGIHVLCEKPLAISTEQAVEMAKKAAQKNLLLLTAFKFRFYDEVQKAKELIDTKGLGPIVSFRLMFGGASDMTGTWYGQKALSGGGILMDNGPHVIDLIRYLFGEVKAISADVAHHQNMNVEDTGTLHFITTSGARGSAEMSWSISVPSKAYLEIYGEDGTALLDPEGINYKFKTWSEWKRVPNQVTGPEAFARQINHFVDAILGKPPTIVTNADGIQSQVVVEAAYESVKQHRVITID